MNNKYSSINQAFLLLGSNIEPEKNLPKAVKLLSQYGHIRKVSSVWQSAAAGFTEQPDFLNAAMLLETDLSPDALRRQAIHTVEDSLERIRTENKNGPRTIDIDIILFNRDVLNLGTRHIPDPDLQEQLFVAMPLAEIAPDYLHPELNQTLEEIAHQLYPKAEAIFRRDDVKLV
ncbi:hypothetical protein ADN00_00625 [Ornatilinea apprima]|uniref:2-amino-4-hydroxy-6-hydroxymethyldihydropteridine diphosphokinase n=1 Tax=Ornatilinea apprima TaxID=1134406 RepID=A0A0P6XY62_9CHLR|nr:2-amino-4-hydroxy-6-hydroxymethyldihydropteridine diphosphokinase [Ornatilinea apprima]KPL81070.1 hypothetical protein ADN00_00625 [Ornatilinea apprima]